MLTACIWGFAFVAQVKGVEHIGSLTMNGVRFLIGAVALAPFAAVIERGKAEKSEKIRTLKASLLAGTVLFCASTLQQLGIEATGSAGIAGFITGLYTVFIPIACYLLFKQKTCINVWIGALLATAGLFLLCYRVGEGLHFGVGELLLLVGSFFWTAHVIVIDKLGKAIRPLHFSCGQFAVCAAIGIIFMFIFEEPSMGAIADAKWSVLYCGLLSSGVGYTLQVVAQKHVEPTVAAIIMSLEATFSAVGGVIFGIDKLTALGTIGCALMLAGIIISQITPKGKAANMAPRDGKS